MWIETYPFKLLVREANTVLHTDFITNTALLTKNSDALDLDALLDDAGRVTANGDRGSLNTSPGANAAAPSNDRVHNTGIVADLCILENNGVLDTGTSTNNHTGSNGDVRSQLGSGVNGGSGVDEDWRHDHGRGRSELLRLGLECLLEVQGIGRNGRTGGLDLAPEVLSLVNEEAVAVSEIRQNVLLQAEHLALLGILVIGDEGGLKVIGGGVGEHAGTSVPALDGAANGGEDAIGSEQVDTAVDQVGDMRLGLLDVVQNTLGMRIGDNATKVSGGVVANARTQNDGLGILLLEQTQHLAQRERAADVSVQHKQALRLALEDRITEVVETTGRTQRSVFPQVLDAELGELLRGILDKVTEDALIVVSNQNDLAHIGDLGERGEAVVNDRVAGDFEKGLTSRKKASGPICCVESQGIGAKPSTHLRHIERQWAETSAPRGTSDLFDVSVYGEGDAASLRHHTRITALVEAMLDCSRIGT